MAQSRTLFRGMDVHPETSAVAYGAHEPGAAVPSLGPSGTRPCDSAHLVRKMPSKAPHRLFLSAAGPGGSWLSRSPTTKDDDGGVVAPSLLPKSPGDRVTTNRRDAVQLARLARAGARPLVSVPTGDDAASRALPRARADTSRALKDAQVRRKAVWLSQDSQ